MEQYNELYHYGVKGMKWGIRRYQNENGTLTPAGKKKAKQEYKADNKQAYEIGKAATVYGHATAKSLNRTAKLEKRLNKQQEKDPSGSKRRTQSLKKKLDASTMASGELMEKYSIFQNAAEKHCNSLIKKYGKEAVSEIKYTDKTITSRKYGKEKFTTMNEKTNTMSDYARAGAETLATSAALTMMGMPFVYISRPATTSEKASYLASTKYQEHRKAQKENR